MNEEMKPLLLQLNFPFCFRKCSYCMAQTCPYDLGTIHAYCSAMQKEIAAASEDMTDYIVTAISLEGGCPGLCAPEDLQKILFALKKNFTLDEHVQISLQTNPGEHSRSLIQRMRDHGVNHWIFGIQTTNWKELELLERPYRWDTLSMVDVAVRNFDMHDRSFELLYGIPGQTEQSFFTSLEKIASYRPEHVTLNALILPEGTRLRERIDSGELPAQDPVLMEAMYCKARDFLKKIGLMPYTICDFAKPGHENRFRLGQLFGMEQLGIGYLARTWMDGVVYQNGHSLKEYLAHPDDLSILVNAPARPDDDSLFRQEVVFGLTRADGLALCDIRDRYPDADACRTFFDETMDALIHEGFAVQEDGKLLLTPRGIVAADVIWERI